LGSCARQTTQYRATRNFFFGDRRVACYHPSAHSTLRIFHISHSIKK
jgi:hypothetical protein